MHYVPPLSLDVRRMVLYVLATICLCLLLELIPGKLSSHTMDNLVINCSDCRLSKDQISILSKGLKFCSTPGEPRPGDLMCDLDSQHRMLRLHSYFKDEKNLSPQKGVTSTPLMNLNTPNSGWHPNLIHLAHRPLSQ